MKIEEGFGFMGKTSKGKLPESEIALLCYDEFW
jgi:hypothetical protein